jgi:hypothetical protein
LFCRKTYTVLWQLFFLQRWIIRYSVVLVMALNEHTARALIKKGVNCLLVTRIFSWRKIVAESEQKDFMGRNRHA